MMTLYHAQNSVCSQKARLVFFERHVPWTSAPIDLTRDEQFSASYLALNPDAVVPTLVDGDLVIRESSLILEYVDEAGDEARMMPTEAAARVATKLWLIRTLAIHDAINSLSFATFIGEMVRQTRSPEEIEEDLNRLPSPQVAAKRRDVFKNGPRSVFVAGAVQVMSGVFRDMDAALAEHDYLTGPDYGLADMALTAYVDRVANLGMQGLWADRFDRVGSVARPGQGQGQLRPGNRTTSERRSIELHVAAGHRGLARDRSLDQGTAGTRPSSMKIRVQQVGVVLLVMAFWALGDRIGLFNPDVIPPIHEVAAAIGTVSGRAEFLPSLWLTLRDSLASVAIATLVGVPLGLWIGMFPKVEISTRILLDFGRTFPAIALIPIFILIVGTNHATKILLTTIACFFPILVQTIYGARRLDPTVVDTVAGVPHSALHALSQGHPAGRDALYRDRSAPVAQHLHPGRGGGRGLYAGARHRRPGRACPDL